MTTTALWPLGEKTVWISLNSLNRKEKRCAADRLLGRGRRGAAGRGGAPKC